MGARHLVSRVLGGGLLSGLLVSGLALGAIAPATAAEQPSIGFIEATDDGVRMLISVPAGSEVDHDGVSVRIDDVEVDSDAEPFRAADVELLRTTVLAIDTSNSMRGDRWDAALAAATAFLDATPDDVRVGIVTFASDVERVLEPTTDRDAARSVLEDLDLSRQTRLYDGLLEAVAMTGDRGQRAVLLLSDGRDTSETAIDDVTAALAGDGARVNVVSLEVGARALRQLEALADAGSGQLINATSADLAETFSSEADVLSRQVLVTAEVPDSVTGDEATIGVTLPTTSGVLEVRALGQVRVPSDGAEALPPLPSSGGGGFVITPVMMYAGVAALGLGLVVLLGVLLGGSRPAAVTVEQRIGAYGVHPTQKKPEAHLAFTAQARDTAAQVLHRNQGLEARVAARLEAAGSAMKPSEWVLLHGGIVFAAGLVGLLLSGFNPFVMILFLLLGGVLPWVWLGFRRTRRLKAFSAGLADTLQLIAGSLQAGLSLTQAIDTVVKEGNDPIASEFKRVLVETRLGVPVDTALEEVAARMGSKDFSWVVMAIRIQREVGGNLAELMLTVAATLRERDYLRRQVATLSAEGRLSAWVLGALPPLFLLYLILVRRDYVMVLFTDPRGWVMLAAAALLLGVGAFWMSKLVKVEV